MLFDYKSLKYYIWYFILFDINIYTVYKLVTSVFNIKETA